MFILCFIIFIIIIYNIIGAIFFDCYNSYMHDRLDYNDRIIDYMLFNFVSLTTNEKILLKKCRRLEESLSDLKKEI